jgi:hypothetical protein
MKARSRCLISLTSLILLMSLISLISLRVVFSIVAIVVESVTNVLMREMRMKLREMRTSKVVLSVQNVLHVLPFCSWHKRVTHLQRATRVAAPNICTLSRIGKASSLRSDASQSSTECRYLSLHQPRSPFVGE